MSGVSLGSWISCLRSHDCHPQRSFDFQDTTLDVVVVVIISRRAEQRASLAANLVCAVGMGHSNRLDCRSATLSRLQVQGISVHAYSRRQIQFRSDLPGLTAVYQAPLTRNQSPIPNSRSTKIGSMVPSARGPTSRAAVKGNHFERMD
jgi:hypothetical protein